MVLITTRSISRSICASTCSDVIVATVRPRFRAPTDSRSMASDSARQNGCSQEARDSEGDATFSTKPNLRCGKNRQLPTSTPAPVTATPVAGAGTKNRPRRSGAG